VTPIPDDLSDAVWDSVTECTCPCEECSAAYGPDTGVRCPRCPVHGMKPDERWRQWVKRARGGARG